MHSKDALCGLTAGDQTSWRGGVAKSLQDEVKGFEVLAKDDPLAKSNPAATRKLEQARQTLVAHLQAEDLYTSVRKGVLPPGVGQKASPGPDVKPGAADGGRSDLGVLHQGQRRLQGTIRRALEQLDDGLPGFLWLDVTDDGQLVVMLGIVPTVGAKQETSRQTE
jgi:hypothetical protein